MISYFSLMPDLHVLLLQSPSLPFRDQLLRLDQRWLSLILMVAFLVAMVIKVSRSECAEPHGVRRCRFHGNTVAAVITKDLRNSTLGELILMRDTVRQRN